MGDLSLLDGDGGAVDGEEVYGKRKGWGRGGKGNWLVCKIHEKNVI